MIIYPFQCCEFEGVLKHHYSWIRSEQRKSNGPYLFWSENNEEEQAEGNKIPMIIYVYTFTQVSILLYFL